LVIASSMSSPATRSDFAHADVRQPDRIAASVAAAARCPRSSTPVCPPRSEAHRPDRRRLRLVHQVHPPRPARSALLKTATLLRRREPDSTGGSPPRGPKEAAPAVHLPDKYPSIASVMSKSADHAVLQRPDRRDRPGRLAGSFLGDRCRRRCRCSGTAVGALLTATARRLASGTMPSPFKQTSVLPTSEVDAHVHAEQPREVSQIYGTRSL